MKFDLPATYYDKLGELYQTRRSLFGTKAQTFILAREADRRRGKQLDARSFKDLEALILEDVEPLAYQGDQSAQFVVGYLSPWKFTKNIWSGEKTLVPNEEGLKWFKLAGLNFPPTQSGMPEAQLSVALAYMNLAYGSSDNDQALIDEANKWMDMACAQHFPPAMAMLADCGRFLAPSSVASVLLPAARKILARPSPPLCSDSELENLFAYHGAKKQQPAKKASSSGSKKKKKKQRAKQRRREQQRARAEKKRHAEAAARAKAQAYAALQQKAKAAAAARLEEEEEEEEQQQLEQPVEEIALAVPVTVARRVETAAPEPETAAPEPETALAPETAAPPAAARGDAFDRDLATAIKQSKLTAKDEATFPGRAAMEFRRREEAAAAARPSSPPSPTLNAVPSASARKNARRRRRKRQQKQLAVGQRRHAEEGGVCSICMDMCESPVVTKCAHVFCKACIQKWMAQGGKTCPTCRKAISGADLVACCQPCAPQEPAPAPIGRPAAAAVTANMCRQGLLNSYASTRATMNC